MLCWVNLRQRIPRIGDREIFHSVLPSRSSINFIQFRIRPHQTPPLSSAPTFREHWSLYWYPLVIAFVLNSDPVCRSRSCVGGRVTHSLAVQRIIPTRFTDNDDDQAPSPPRPFVRRFACPPTTSANAQVFLAYVVAVTVQFATRLMRA